MESFVGVALALTRKPPAVGGFSFVGGQGTWRRHRRRRPARSMTRGTVKWFNDAKGFGFLTREGGPDVFVHHSEIRSDGFRSLNEGDQVEFEVVDSPKGPRAANVTRI
jgi:CspA family cold shock protein